MTRWAKLLTALALLPLCARSASADNPRKVAIGSGSAKGALLFKVPPLPIDYQLLLLRIDEAQSRFVREWIYIKAVPFKEGDRFIVTTLPPGEYLLEGVSQQSQWVACLQARTLRVLVRPGSVAYLGSLDARPTLASIQRNAATPKGRIAHFGQWHFYWTNVVAPRVSGRDGVALAGANSFVREQMPKSSATAGLADLKWGPYAAQGTSQRANRCI